MSDELIKMLKEFRTYGVEVRIKHENNSIAWAGFWIALAAALIAQAVIFKERIF